jgi:hypothetical protein
MMAVLEGAAQELFRVLLFVVFQMLLVLEMDWMRSILFGNA